VVSPTNTGFSARVKLFRKETFTNLRVSVKKSLSTTHYGGQTSLTVLRRALGLVRTFMVCLSIPHTRDTAAATAYSNQERLFLYWTFDGHIHDASNPTVVTMDNIHSLVAVFIVPIHGARDFDQLLFLFVLVVG
jgi:hypothetical protein